MKDETLISCPVKGSYVFRWVCAEKCGRTQAQCDAARLEMQAETRACIECGNFESERQCAPCIDADGLGRERHFWSPAPVENVDKYGQMSLF